MGRSRATRETSAGGVVFRAPQGEEPVFLLIRDSYRNWGFPKGHLEDAEPHEVLKELMAARGLKQGDVGQLLGSKGRVSEVINGKRAISKAQAKALAEFFHVSAELFI